MAAAMGAETHFVAAHAAAPDPEWRLFAAPAFRVVERERKKAGMNEFFRSALAAETFPPRLDVLSARRAMFTFWQKKQPERASHAQKANHGRVPSQGRHIVSNRKGSDIAYQPNRDGNQH
jgi:hypothetical protein